MRRAAFFHAFQLLLIRLCACAWGFGRLALKRFTKVDGICAISDLLFLEAGIV